MTRVDRLDAATVDEVFALARAAADADGTYPFAEHVVLHLRHGGDSPAVHLLARDSGGRLVGYAHVDPTDEVEGASAELAVHPDSRRRGLGRALVSAAVAVASEPAGPSPDPGQRGPGQRGPGQRGPGQRGRLRLWAHGEHPAAAALARSLGFTRTRVLWQLRRSLFAPIPDPVLPDGVVLRAFRPGVDDQAWLAVNARAFADHPEQGRWTQEDLRVRMAESWFDPAGFLLAVRERDGQLLGFHWTKVHGGDGLGAAGGSAGSAPHHDHDPIGEVYVLGVDPAAHGLGLGTALTLAGLRHLRGRGLDQAMLYVDDSNQAAVTLYTKLGFTRWSVDVAFTREP